MQRSPFLSLISMITLSILMFSCTPSEEKLAQKAQAIHQEVLTLDSHTDTPLRMMRSGFDISKRNDPYARGGKIDFPRMVEGGQDAAFFAVFLGQGPLGPDAYKRVKEQANAIFDVVHQTLEKHPEQAELALTPEDAYRLQEEGKRAIYIGLENGYPIGEDLSMVEAYYDMGARYITLSHTRNNQICDSSTDEGGPLHNGLSEFGKEVVREMNRLGMMVDVSHISDKAFYDVLELSRAPVIASHSNARAICDNPRNLNDEMLLALAENGGVIQMCVLSSYVKDLPANAQRDSAFAAMRAAFPDRELLSDDEMDQLRNMWDEINRKYPAPMATVSDLIDHIDHIVNLIGIDYVGIGTDFDGGGALEDCYDVTQMGNITLELVRRGYSKKDIEKIWSGNFMRVFRENERITGKS
ncbi:MAG: membrane dipeptidase [Bacteroidales bacterium]|nr:membrane dipeptidase [Bacteroidales bacterium]